MKREDLDDEELATVKEMLRSYWMTTGMCKERGMTEDEAVESQLELLEAGLLEILKGPEDEEGNFEFMIVPTAKAITAYTEKAIVAYEKEIVAVEGVQRVS